MHRWSLVEFTHMSIVDRNLRRIVRKKHAIVTVKCTLKLRSVARMTIVNRDPRWIGNPWRSSCPHEPRWAREGNELFMLIWDVGESLRTTVENERTVVEPGIDVQDDVILMTLQIYFESMWKEEKWKSNGREAQKYLLPVAVPLIWTCVPLESWGEICVWYGTCWKHERSERFERFDSRIFTKP